MTVKDTPGKSGRTVHEYDSKVLGTGESHPAYGIASFSRVSWSGSGTRLYGSSLPRHGTTIRLRIHRSERSTDLHHDHFFERDRIIEVEFSPVQFAELLTSMNFGNGVPCTIRWDEVNAHTPDIPDDEETLIERVNEDWSKELAGLREAADALAKRADESLTKSPVPAQERKDLLHDIKMLAQKVRSNFPFLMESFGRAASQVVAAAKAEVDATVTHAIQATGLKELEHLRLGDGMPSKKEGQEP